MENCKDKPELTPEVVLTGLVLMLGDLNDERIALALRPKNTVWSIQEQGKPVDHRTKIAEFGRSAVRLRSELNYLLNNGDNLVEEITKKTNEGVKLLAEFATYSDKKKLIK